MKPRTPILRKAAPKKTNPARRRKEFARCYHSAERVTFVRNLPCCACHDAGYSENAHVPPVGEAGMGHKAGYRFIAPLCPLCHRNRLHLWGRQQFEEYFHVDLESAAAQTEKLWRSSLGSSPGGHQK